MPDLILVNGPPASGKSTIAARLVAVRPLALNVDIDLVRASLGQWKEQPIQAGLAARRLAIGMASLHLQQGHHVVVPQFLARPEFIVQLETTAVAARANFVEIALMLSRKDALDAFARRSTHAATEQHRDAAEMVDRGGPSIGEMYDAYVALVAARPGARCIDITVGDVDACVALVESAIAVDSPM